MLPPGAFIPPIGDPILPRLRHANADFDWTFGGEYEPIFVDSGTTALRLAIEVATHRSGRHGTAWVPAYGCPDILAATLAAGASPVLYDTGADRPFFAPGQQAPDNLVAAVAAHFLGLVHPPEYIADATRNTGALLIEDSAQRFPMPGERFYGDAVVLSFGRGKPISLMGGGCLLLKANLRADASAALSSYGWKDTNVAGHIRRGLHDLVIRPRVYGLVRHLPPLRIGKVEFKPAPPPSALGPHARQLAGKAANAYVAETLWLYRQNRTVEFASERFPALQPLAPHLGQPRRRLTRVPFLAASAADAKTGVARANHMRIGASMMYGAAQPYICGTPNGLTGKWADAARFAERIVVFPSMDPRVVVLESMMPEDDQAKF